MTSPLQTISPSRRSFIQSTAALSAALAVGALSSGVYAQTKETLRVGLIGCGGRGRGAAKDTLAANKGVKIVALGDLFPDRLDSAKEDFRKLPKDQQDLPDDRCFVGFDAYKKVLATDVDLVILATPPGFRPQHIQAAVEAGKHIFAEKPVAVCPSGVRMVLAAGELGIKKGLCFVGGTQRRRDFKYRDIIKRIHDGQIGDVVSASVFWNGGELWSKARLDGMTDTEWMIRNWLYFTWMSGDHIVEQHIHNIDIMNWAFNSMPISAYGTGGRQVRVDPAYGHIYDHFFIEYEYPNDRRGYSMCRQQKGTETRVGELITGTKGTAIPAQKINGEQAYVSKEKADFGPYQQEHKELVDAIRAGQLLNETKQLAELALCGIMGRLAAYTGSKITWDMAFKSQLNLMPPIDLAFGPREIPKVAIPGQEKFV